MGNGKWVQFFSFKKCGFHYFDLGLPVIRNYCWPSPNSGTTVIEVSLVKNSSTYKALRRLFSAIVVCNYDLRAAVVVVVSALLPLWICTLNGYDLAVFCLMSKGIASYINISDELKYLNGN